MCAAGFLQGLDPKLRMVGLGLGNGKVTFIMLQSHCSSPCLWVLFLYGKGIRGDISLHLRLYVQGIRMERAQVCSKGTLKQCLKTKKAKVCILCQFHFSPDFRGCDWLDCLVSGS